MPCASSQRVPTNAARYAWLSLPLLHIAPGGAGLLLASVGALSTAPAAAATYLDINLTSVHHRRGWKEQGRVIPFNDGNFGIGLTHEIRNFLEVKAGFYDNSYYKTSGYAVANFIYHARFGPVTVAPAFGIGLVSGYRGTSCDYTHGRSNVEPAIFPNLNVGAGPVRISIGAIPRVKGDLNVLTLQFEFKLPQ